ncbi:helitron helicase-like domain-containing protein [Artemisia annua]|uniref:Helitron helicase-like domain-containing protein n=1 Tax=Artemisia annua TaxID=35608 RepID=A0A2U1MNJ9_ARTAN|nr:helitron helicase-like domain-containing protein [Artemisia annua]
MHECVAIPTGGNRAPTSFDNQCNTPSPLTRYENLRLTSSAVSSQDALYKENERISNRMFQVHNGLGSHEPNVPLDTFIGRGRRTSKRQRELKEQRFKECGSSSQNSAFGDVPKRMPSCPSVCLPSEYRFTDAGQGDLTSSSESHVHIVTTEHCHQPRAPHSSMNTRENDIVYNLSFITVEQPTSSAPPPGRRKKRAMSQTSLRRPSIRRRCSTSGANEGASPVYQDIGDCTERCRYCDARFWPGEQLAGHRSNTGHPIYHLCCGDGKLLMDPEVDPPEYIKHLLGQNTFMQNIRAYNQMFAMTSFGATIDNTVNQRRGPYVFKVSGQIYHWIGALCPTGDDDPCFLQLYIYDTANEVRNKMSHFEDSDGHPLDPEIVQGLIEFLDAHNELVQLFGTARDKCAEAEVPNFKVRLFNAKGSRNYELPTSDALGAIVFDSGPTTEADYDVIIEYRDAPPKRINKLHQSYMSLQFPLIFIYGQPGYHTKLMLRSADPNEKMKQQKAIVCPKNETADTINSQVLKMVDGESTTYASYDIAIPMEDAGIHSIEYPATEKVVHDVDATVGEETDSSQQKMVEVTYPEAPQEGTTEVNVAEKLNEPTAASDHKAPVPTQTGTPVTASTKISQDYSQKETNEDGKTKAQESDLFEDEPSDIKKQKATGTSSLAGKLKKATVTKKKNH